MSNLDEMLGNYSFKNSADVPHYGTVKPPSMVENMIRDSQQDKIESVRENITDIENMIRHREDLSKETIKAIDEVVDRVDTVLLDLHGYALENVNAERTDLKKEMLKKKFDMIQCKVNEKVSLWQDVAALKKEMREHCKELREIESKNTMLMNLMGL